MENDKILDNLISGEVPIQNNGLVHFSDIQIPLKISFISLMSCQRNFSNQNYLPFNI